MEGGDRARWRPTGADLLAAAFLSVACAIGVLPFLMFSVGAKSSEAYDADHYHIPLIRQFASELPTPDLVTYPSATTPGWHLLMSVAYSASGTMVVPRVLNLGFGLALTLLVYIGARRFVNPAAAACLSLPVAWCQYVLGSSWALTTDNLALVLAVASLMLSVLARGTPGRIAWAGVAAVGVVLVRQLFIWVIAPIGLAGVSVLSISRLLPRVLQRSDVPVTARERWRIVAAAAFGVVAPLAALAAFVAVWGGLVPNNEEMRAHFRDGYDAAVIVYALTLVCVFAPLLIVPLVPMLRDEGVRWRGAAVSGSLGLAASAVWPTQWEATRHQYGWVWTLVREFGRLTGGRFESVGSLQMVERPWELIPGRSPLMHVTAAAGGVMVWLLWRSAAVRGEGRRAAILLLTMLGFLVAQGFNTVVAQRYFEPVVVVSLVWLAALGCSERRNGARRGPAWMLPAAGGVLGAAQLAATLMTG